MAPFSSIPARALEQLKLPLYERIRLDLQSRLVEQAWDPAQPIPTEQVLAQEYNASIGTVRKAIEHLVQEGLLYKAQGRGTFIKQPDFKGSLLRFFRYRNQLGVQEIPVGVVKSVKKVPPVAAINQQLKIAKNVALIQLKRIRLVKDQVALSEQIWLPEPIFAPLLDFAPADFGNLLYPFYYQHCGQFIFSAKETLSFTTDHTDTELGTQPNEPLVQIERVAYNLESKPVEYRLSYGQAHNFKYEVRIA
ncbi:GntR family transcriptional regulator [Paenalcaligenes hominis]|uniref:GntR family transcriptional regulator n=1 Tax=Paenalcaligenes hominis TaxID=643674 RepID=UPI003525394F